jgi:hypothetical protein
MTTLVLSLRVGPRTSTAPGGGGEAYGPASRVTAGDLGVHAESDTAAAMVRTLMGVFT